MSLLTSLYALDIYCFDQNNDTVVEKEKLTSLYTLTMKILRRKIEYRSMYLLKTSLEYRIEYLFEIKS